MAGFSAWFLILNICLASPCWRLKSFLTVQNCFMISDDVLMLDRCHETNLIDGIFALYCRHLAYVCLFQCIQLAVGESLCPVHDAIRPLAKDLLDLHTINWMPDSPWSKEPSWPDYTHPSRYLSSANCLLMGLVTQTTSNWALVCDSATDICTRL